MTAAAAAATSAVMANPRIAKVVMVGDSGVGKTSLVQRYVNNTFSHSSRSTVGVEFYNKNVTLYQEEDKQDEGERTVKLQIWDTAGQERYRAITTAYYRGAMAVLLVFSFDNPTSFGNLDKWYTEASQFVNMDSTLFVVVGNKMDLQCKTTATANDAKAFATTHNALYFETSAALAAHGEIITDLFRQIATHFLAKEKNKEENKEATATSLVVKKVNHLDSVHHVRRSFFSNCNIL